MENQTTIKFKRWEDLDITDDFIFSRVMRNKKLCRTLLEMILKVQCFLALDYCIISCDYLMPTSLKTVLFLNKPL